MKKSVAEVLKSAMIRLEEGGIDSPKLDAEILLAHALNRYEELTKSDSSLKIFTRAGSGVIIIFKGG